MYLLVKYSVGPVGCVRFVELKGVECLGLLSFLLGLLRLFGLLGALGLLN